MGVFTAFRLYVPPPLTVSAFIDRRPVPGRGRGRAPLPDVHPHDRRDRGRLSEVLRGKDTASCGVASLPSWAKTPPLSCVFQLPSWAKTLPLPCDHQVNRANPLEPARQDVRSVPMNRNQRDGMSAECTGLHHLFGAQGSVATAAISDPVVQSVGQPRAGTYLCRHTSVERQRRRGAARREQRGEEGTRGGRAAAAAAAAGGGGAAGAASDTRPLRPYLIWVAALNNTTVHRSRAQRPRQRMQPGQQPRRRRKRRQ